MSPGRVNLLGEHVDYNQGLVLPIAIDRFVRLSARPRVNDLVSIEALDLQQKVRFRLEDLNQRVGSGEEPLPAWALYAAGVAWALKNNGLETCGLDIALTSDLPIGAGLSSSAAVELAYGLAWQAACGWEMDRMRLALICQQAENQYVGVQCGLMDQFACAHGVARHALFFDTRSLQWQPLPMPPATAVVIADSGIRRQLANSGYNQRREECEQAVEILRESLPGIRALRDVNMEQLNTLEDRLPAEIRSRARHVVAEIERVRQACVCLAQDDAVGFGKLMAESHASLRDLFAVSLPELDELVESALNLEGCLGAKLSGAGFGGCTVNLVRSDCAQNFMESLKDSYSRKFGREANVYLCQAGRGAHLVSE